MLVRLVISPSDLEGTEKCRLPPSSVKIPLSSGKGAAEALSTSTPVEGPSSVGQQQDSKLL